MRSVVVCRRRGGAARFERCAEEDGHGRRGRDDPRLRTKGGFLLGQIKGEVARDHRDGQHRRFTAPRLTPGDRLEDRPTIWTAPGIIGLAKSSAR